MFSKRPSKERKDGVGELRGGPGTPFRDFLGISGLGGVETPVYGDCHRKGGILTGEIWGVFLYVYVP